MVLDSTDCGGYGGTRQYRARAREHNNTMEKKIILNFTYLFHVPEH